MGICPIGNFYQWVSVCSHLAVVCDHNASAERFLIWNRRDDVLASNTRLVHYWCHKQCTHHSPGDISIIATLVVVIVMCTPMLYGSSKTYRCIQMRSKIEDGTEWDIYPEFEARHVKKLLS